MTPLLVSYIVIASMATLVGCHHLMVFARRRDLPLYRTFALLALAMAGHSVVILYRFQELPVEAVVWLTWLQWCFELLMLWLLVRFIQRFTGGGRTGRWLGWAVAPFAVLHLVLLPEGFARSGPVTTQMIDLVTGDRFLDVAAPLRWTYYPFALLVLVILGWGIGRAIGLARSGGGVRGYALAAALVAICAAVLNSIVLIDLLELPSIQVIDHSFVALVLVMGLVLSDEMVRAGRLRRELQAREADLHSTFDAIRDGIVAIDAEGRITRTNPAAGSLLAADGDLTGSRAVDVVRLLDPDDHRPIPLPIDRLLAGEVLDDIETFLLEGSGGVEVEIGGAPILGRSGDDQGAVLVMRDVTERTRLEAELLQSRKMDALGKLAGGVAHDFNNMLAGIMGAAELLTSKLGDDPKMRSRAELITESAARAGELTQQLLAFARRGRVARKVLSVHESIRSAVALFSGGGDRSVTVETHLEAEVDTVRGDHAMLQSAILNLLVNARDAIGSSGTVTLATRNDEAGGLAVTIRDTGSGMTPEVREQIFDPFFTTKSDASGTGLGLAMVYGTVQAMKGRIACDSQPGWGTLFTIHLPVTRGTTTRRHRSGAEGRSGSRLLVVDDDAVVRRTTAAVLEHHGYHVDAVANGDTALERFGDGRLHDLVVLDVLMPGMDGLALYGELKQRNAKVHCIAVSGFADSETFEALRAEGITSILTKPFRAKELADAVRRELAATGEG